MRSPVAVIVATRDRPDLLADALGCVAAQTAAPLEVRIANDGEIPAEAAVREAGLLEVTLIPTAAERPGAARNLAAASARAEWLAFLDDDDRWLPVHLEGFAPAFEDPSCQVAYRDCAVVRERLEPAGLRHELERRVIARSWDPAVMAENDYVPPSALAMRRSLFERLGGFDTAFTYSEDWDLLLRAAAVATPRRVPGVTVEVRLRDQGNLSADRGAERQACLDRLSARHGLPPLIIKTFWEVALDVGASTMEDHR